MIEPTEADIGKTVYYKKDWMKPKQYESGVITSLNISYVFVRYGTELQAKSTRREDLYWDANPLPEKKPRHCCTAMERALNDNGYPFHYIEQSGAYTIIVDNDNMDVVALLYCPYCGAQLWRECPSCHGLGEVMHRDSNADDGGNSETPYVKGCSQCTLEPGLIPVRPVHTKVRMSCEEKDHVHFSVKQCRAIIPPEYCPPDFREKLYCCDDEGHSGSHHWHLFGATVIIEGDV